MKVAEVLKLRSHSDLEERVRAGRRSLVFVCVCLAPSICLGEDRNHGAVELREWTCAPGAARKREGFTRE